jgi:hypothetical protein
VRQSLTSFLSLSPTLSPSSHLIQKQQVSLHSSLLALVFVVALVLVLLVLLLVHKVMNLLNGFFLLYSHHHQHTVSWNLPLLIYEQVNNEMEEGGSKTTTPLHSLPALRLSLSHTLILIFAFSFGLGMTNSQTCFMMIPSTPPPIYSQLLQRPLLLFAKPSTLLDSLLALLITLLLSTVTN